RIEKNLKQHRDFLKEVEEDSEQHRDIKGWFKTLPVYLDLPGLRVIHACWHIEHLATLAPYLDDQQRIRAEAWPELAKKGTAAFESLEIVLKGLEIPLPAGQVFYDTEENPRRHIRTRWWQTSETSYKDLAIVPPKVRETVPDIPAPVHKLPGYDGEKPLFVGHYWFTGEPVPQTPHIACLDYSIANPDPDATETGKLCAYRWDGEEVLRKEQFIWVDG
ncbi:MAG: metallophosphoesterase, partial [Pseudohongiellaceae bacterium]